MTALTQTAAVNRKLERIAKGFANHRRIQMMQLLEGSPDLSLHEIAQRLRVNVKTASEHLRRLAIAGLISKRNRGRFVEHALSDRGIASLRFLRQME